MSTVRVEFHPETFEALFTETLQVYPGLAQALLEDFRLYKQTNKLPAYFGRDAPYVQPVAAFNARLMHIHLRFPPEQFPKHLPQIDRVCRKGAPDKDAALIYVRGWIDEDHYCLLGVLHPDAHAKARGEKIMRYLARLAQKFRDDN